MLGSQNGHLTINSYKCCMLTFIVFCYVWLGDVKAYTMKIINKKQVQDWSLFHCAIQLFVHSHELFTLLNQSS